MGPLGIIEAPGGLRAPWRCTALYYLSLYHVLNIDLCGVLKTMLLLGLREA